jgi:hypothetical protein
MEMDGFNANVAANIGANMARLEFLSFARGHQMNEKFFFNIARRGYITETHGEFQAERAIHMKA